MDADPNPRQMMVRFSGRVQGVGFRYTVCRLADTSAITGYVRNLSDGDVELVAEGHEAVLSDFLRDIRNSHLRAYIVKDRVSWNRATGKYDQFGVTY